MWPCLLSIIRHCSDIPSFSLCVWPTCVAFASYRTEAYYHCQLNTVRQLLLTLQCTAVAAAAVIEHGPAAAESAFNRKISTFVGDIGAHYYFWAFGCPAASGESEMVKCKLAQPFDECKLPRVGKGILAVSFVWLTLAVGNHLVLSPALSSLSHFFSD